MKNKELNILNKEFNKVFILSNSKLAFCFSVTFIQTYIFCLYKRRFFDNKGQIKKFLLEEYLIKKNKEEFDFLDFSKSFLIKKYNHILEDKEILKLFNFKYKTNFNNLTDFIQNLYDKKLNDLQLNIIDNFISNK